MKWKHDLVFNYINLFTVRILSNILMFDVKTSCCTSDAWVPIFIHRSLLILMTSLCLSNRLVNYFKEIWGFVNFFTQLTRSESCQMREEIIYLPELGISRKHTMKIGCGISQLFWPVLYLLSYLQGTSRSYSIWDSGGPGGGAEGEGGGGREEQMRRVVVEALLFFVVLLLHLRIDL